MTAAAEVDGTDLEIIDLLEGDARRTFAAIGAQVNLSAPAVKRRIDRLERLGVIKGYTVIVDRAQIGRPLEAFTELRFAGATPVSEIRSVVMSVPEVEAVFTVAGDPDALAWIRAADIAHLTRVIDQLRRSGRVTGTKTMMVLHAQVRRWEADETGRRGYRVPSESRTGTSLRRAPFALSVSIRNVGGADFHAA